MFPEVSVELVYGQEGRSHLFGLLDDLDVRTMS